MVGRAPLGDLRALAQNPCNPTTTNPHHPHPHPPTRVARVGPALSLRDRLQPAPQPDRPPNQAQKLETQLESAHTRMGGGGGALGRRERRKWCAAAPRTQLGQAPALPPHHTRTHAHTRVPCWSQCLASARFGRGRWWQIAGAQPRCGSAPPRAGRTGGSLQGGWGVGHRAQCEPTIPMSASGAVARHLRRPPPAHHTLAQFCCLTC